MKLSFKTNCIICGKYYENATAFSLHLKIHKITSNDYYDKYLKTENEGFCKICNKKTKLYSITVGYRPYCSIKCKNLDKKLKEKIKNTNEQRYGGTGFASQELAIKGKETCLRLYGNKNYNNYDQIIKTCLERYGVDNPSKSDIIKIKRENTKLERYGDKYFNNIEKIQETKIKKYNDKNYNNRKSAIETCIRKYGHENPMQVDSVKEKFKQTCMEKYNVEYPTQNKDIVNKGIITFHKNKYIHKIKKSKYYYENVYFDSCPELAYYIWLKENNIDFIYHPNIKLEYYYDGRIHYYSPDFLINNELIELKGLQFFENRDITKRMINPYNHKLDDLFEAKHQCMIYNNVKIITNFKKFFEYINNKYDKTYLVQFKI